MTEKDAMYTQLRWLPPLLPLFFAFASRQTTTYTTDQGGTNQSQVLRTAIHFHRIEPTQDKIAIARSRTILGSPAGLNW